MKFVGFLLEYDKNIDTAVGFNEMTKLENCNQKKRDKIISYLDSGHFVIGAMSFIYDSDGYAIGNLNYLTDGTYIWPSYYAYFLKKYDNFLIDHDLLQFAVKNGFNVKDISKCELSEIEKLFLSNWQKK